jgi:hypothetical protein
VITPFFNALVSTDKGYTPLNLSDNMISDIVEPNIPDTIANTGCIMKNLWCCNFHIFCPILAGDASGRVALETL